MQSSTRARLSNEDRLNLCIAGYDSAIAAGRHKRAELYAALGRKYFFLVYGVQL